MNTRLSWATAGMLACLCLAACGNPQIEIRYNRPPEMTIPDHVKKVGVVPFTLGSHVSESDIGDRVQRKLESALVKGGYYMVVTRSQLETLLKEQKLSFANFAEGGSKDLELKVVDALIIGSVSRAVSAEGKDTLRTLTYKRRGIPIPFFGRIAGRSVPVVEEIKRGRYIVADVAMTFQMIDYSQGGVLVASHEYTRSFDSRTAREGTDGKHYALLPEELPTSHMAKMDELIEAGANEFLRMIMPFEVVRNVELIARGPYSEKGIKMAERGLVDEALEQFDLALRDEDPQDAAYYDKGVMLEVKGRYREAQDAYKQAYLINEDDLYLDAMERIQKELAICE